MALMLQLVLLSLIEIKHAEKKNRELIDVFDFELKLCERIVMTVEEDKMGTWILPTATLSK
jgi:hypothetical protein